MNEENNQIEELEILPPVKAKKRFNVDFSKIFFVCTGIMIFYQGMVILDRVQPLFNGADIIYHIIVNILSIISQFASSTAAAIIFYYVLEFYNAKKKMRVLTDIRKFLLFLLYSHMDIVRYTKPFDGLNRQKNRLQEPSLYLVFDVPFLKEGYNKYVDYDEETFKNELLTHFKNKGKKDTIYKLEKFEKDVNELNNFREYGCFKGFFEDVDNIDASYKELSLDVELYSNEGNFEYISNNIDDYIIFFDECVMLYLRMEEFIESINNKNIFMFLKMLQ